MAKSKLALYIDMVSPYAYMAFHVIRTSPVFKDCEVEYLPVFLGGIMDFLGNTPPAQIRNKGAYMEMDRVRLAKLFNVPMAKKMPPGFPKVTLHVMRALTAVSVVFPEKLVDTFAALYHQSFVEHKDIHTLESLAPCFQDIFGQDGAKYVLSKIATDEVKKLLRARSDEVIATGGFGIPWFAATNDNGETQHFWGLDRVAMVAAHLGLERPQPEGAWRAML